VRPESLCAPEALFFHERRFPCRTIFRRGYPSAPLPRSHPRAKQIRRRKNLPNGVRRYSRRGPERSRRRLASFSIDLARLGGPLRSEARRGSSRSRSPRGSLRRRVPRRNGPRHCPPRSHSRRPPSRSALARGGAQALPLWPEQARRRDRPDASNRGAAFRCHRQGHARAPGGSSSLFLPGIRIRRLENRPAAPRVTARVEPTRGRLQRLSVSCNRGPRLALTDCLPADDNVK
jgi:hypothetical protein